MKVVFDENVSHYLVGLLAQCGAPGELQHTRRAHWNQTPDLVWMSQAIASGYAIVTADRNERTRQLTAEDFRKMGAKVLLLGPFWDHLGIWAKTKWLVARWDKLHERLEQLPQGSCFVVDRFGGLKDIKPKALQTSSLL